MAEVMEGFSSTSDKLISKEELARVYDGFTDCCVCMVD